MSLPHYEKLGLFYLGRRHDLATRQTLPEPLLYESRHLTTHALALGMTGSGKTGLCFDLLEEAAIDGIPAIVIDPKGDLGNLLLTFPDLRAEDFAPWINEDDARTRQLAPSDYAAQQAELWRKGLADWDQNGQRIRRFKEAADFAIYTPGSKAGLPVSILSSLAAPAAEILESAEALREHVGAIVGGLLDLVGIEADPVKGREAVLISTLLQQAWAQGHDLDLVGLIREIQHPPLTQIGVLDLESFYPARERFELALQLNQLLASPGFSTWLEGEPLDIHRFLYTPAGKPRVAVFSIAHLDDGERMFFVTLLLNQVVAWMRTQSGTNSLRALVYMDEIFGYFPPVARPPSKLPLLTLLKQGRAFGVGVVLATQNPVDLDYKGLANIGTWFVGRLQTDRDKARVLEGLQGAAAGRGAAFDQAAADHILSGLGRRIFLLHSVHADSFDIFESRWALSYLRGPLTRAQIQTLMDARRSPPAPASPQAVRSAAPASPPTVTPAANVTGRPILPPEVPQFFVAPRTGAPADARMICQPRLVGAAQIRYANPKLKIDVTREVVLVTPITEDAVPVDWSGAEELELDLRSFVRHAPAAEFVPCPAPASQPANYTRWSRDLVTWLAANRGLTLFRSEALGEVSQPGEDEREFRIRLQQIARETRDRAVERLQRQYAPKLATLQERLRRAEAAQQRESGQAQRAKLDTAISLGSTLLGALLGRKTVSAGTIGKAATTMRSAGRAMDQAGDVTRARETVEAVRQQLRKLEADLEREIGSVGREFDPTGAPPERIELLPARTGIQVRLVALLWLPFQAGANGEIRPAW